MPLKEISWAFSDNHPKGFFAWKNGEIPWKYAVFQLRKLLHGSEKTFENRINRKKLTLLTELILLHKY